MASLKRLATMPRRMPAYPLPEAPFT